MCIRDREKAEVSAKYEAQEEENKELQAVLDNEDKDEYIEKKARRVCLVNEVTRELSELRMQRVEVGG